MERSIVGFHQDPEGNWVSELDCGHNQHLYHRPPFQVRPWVLEEESRRSHLGTPIDCPLCDRAELPEGLRLARLTPEWDESSLPTGLRRAHRLAPRTWGRLEVRRGRLIFRAETSPPIDEELGEGAVQAIPPAVAHSVELMPGTSIQIGFWQVVPFAERQLPEHATGSEEGGESACWAHLVCPECGVLSGEEHRAGCAEAL